MNALPPAADNEIVFDRLIHAPRALVFQAFTDPAHLPFWWGPKGFTNTVQEIDVRPGGTWRFIMNGPDGKTYQNTIVWREIVAPERIVFGHGVESAEEPGAFQSVITLEDVQDNKTRVTMRVILESAEACAAVKKFGAVEGGQQTLDKLEAHLRQMAGTEYPPPSDVDFVITRTLNAPRDLVYRAYTEANHLQKWWGPKGFNMKSMSLDLRPGGVFLYGMSAPAGHPMAGEMWGKFVYREITPPTRLSFVVSFTDDQGTPKRHPASPTWPLEVLTIIDFTEADGKTTLVMRSMPINATTEERQTYKAGHASMTYGFNASFEQLIAYLAAL